MQGVPYLSPHKRKTGEKPKWIASSGRGVRYISEKKARERFPAPSMSIAETFKAAAKIREEQVRKKARHSDIPGDHPSFEDSGGFGDIDTGDWGGFAEGDDVESMDELEEINDEEVESFEDMDMSQVKRRAEKAFGKKIFRRRAGGILGKKRTYAENQTRSKKNWNEFIDCATGELAWSPFETFAPVCKCEKSENLPVISFDGT
jgi:hypothetical protein